MDLLVKFWGGQFPLSATFWLGWAVPMVAGYAFLVRGSWWTINNIGLLKFYAIVALFGIYLIVAVVPVWRAAAGFAGPKLLRYLARGIVLFGATLPLFGAGTIVVSLLAIRLGLDDTHDAHRIAEKTAIPSVAHPMAGFWKNECRDNFGLAIAPAGVGMYSVSFCGPGGCFKPGSYRPNTPLVDDKKYQVVNVNTLRVYGHDGWSTYLRCASREARECIAN